MMTIERFLNDFDEMDKLFPSDYIELITDDAFDDNQSCVCTYNGSNDYFDMGMGQWYPGDDPEYEVDGYDDYINTLVDTVVNDYINEYGGEKTDELIKMIRDNLDAILDGSVLDESDFEEKAIENFLNS